MHNTRHKRKANMSARWEIFTLIEAVFFAFIYFSWLDLLTTILHLSQTVNMTSAEAMRFTRTKSSSYEITPNEEVESTSNIQHVHVASIKQDSNSETSIRKVCLKWDIASSYSKMAWNIWRSIYTKGSFSRI